MKSARTSFLGEAEKKAYVMECEKSFEHSLDIAVERLLGEKDNKIITLSGPTCSGKTTTANKIVSEFEERGKRVHVISIDDFYYDRDVLVKRSEKSGTPLDFDSVSTIDLKELKRTIDEIFEGKTVLVPTFDFKSGKRTEMRKYELDERDVFVFEGIQAVYPEVTALFGDHPYLSVFVYVCEELCVGDQIFDKNEIRFFRRLVRDYNFRNADPEFTFKLWEGVRANEESYILPFFDDCTVLLNSLMPYELGMIKPYVVSLLAKIKADSPYYDYARRTMRRFEHIEEISREYIPQNSVYREFLG